MAARLLLHRMRAPSTKHPQQHPSLRSLVSKVVLAGCLAGALAPAPLGAQAEARPDQIFWTTQRGQPATLSGTVVFNGLGEVEVETTKGDVRKLSSSSVQRIVFGDAPEAFHDGESYYERGDFENAASSFQLVADDPLARPVVQARARLLAAQSELSQGATDVAAFERAKAEAERFLGDFPDNRDVPEARLIQARATRLAGDPAAAAELYRALLKEASGNETTKGYDRVACFSAGEAAAEAYLAAGDVAQAREIFGQLESSLPRALADTEQDDPDRALLAAVQSQARLGEGFCLLASNEVAQAKQFFQGQLDEAPLDDAALRFGAHLGLGEALLTEGATRLAELEFAKVSAIDHTSRDRIARALVGLASCALALPDKDGRAQAENWLRIVREQYGDTTSVLKALELARSL